MVMGTILEITVWNNAFSVAKCFQEAERIENKFSQFMQETEVSKINNSLGLPLKVSNECCTILEKSMQFTELTSGAFDVTKGQGVLTVDDAGKTVLLLPKNNGSNAKIDLGGIVKGYAVDRMSQILKENDVARAMVNFGGNVFLVGYPPDKNIWTIGVKDPVEPDNLMGTINVPGYIGIATSGNYERPGHIVDPETGLAVTACLSVTIVAQDAMTADALSTAVFVMGAEKGIQFVEDLNDVEGVIVTKDDVLVSSGLKDGFSRL